MSDEGITLWDRLVVPHYTLGLVSVGSDEELRQRQAVRVADFAAAVAGAAASAAPDRPDRARAVGEEYGARLQGWARWRARPLKDDDLARWLVSATHCAGTAGGNVIFTAPLYLLAAMLQRALGLGRMARLRRALARRRCPDCRFDLSGSPLLVSEREAGCWIGPERCPECGGIWPMLPPRVGPRAGSEGDLSPRL